MWESGFKATPVSGSERIPWKPGLRLTAIRRRSVKSDGVKEGSLWDGFPWVNALPESPDRITYPYRPHGEALVFKAPCDPIFIGSELGYGDLRPTHVSVPVGCFWPETDRHAGSSISVSVKDAEYICRLGKMRSMVFESNFSSFRISADGLTRQEYEAVGYRLVSESLPPVVIRNGASSARIAFPFKYEEEIAGVRLVSIHGITSNSINPNTFVVESPSAAGTHTPWLEHLLPGTTVSECTSFWQLRGTHAMIPATAICRGLVNSKTVRMEEGCIGIMPKEIPDDLSIPPIKAHVKYGEPLILAKDASGLVQIRSLRAYDTTKISKRRLWRFGQDKPDSGCFYCLASDVKNLPLIDRKSEEAQLASLKEEFPWVTKSHLRYSRDDLSKHNLYLNCKRLGWSTFTRVDGSPKTMLFDIASAIFGNDADVIIKSPVDGTTIYKAPSIEKLRSNPQALDGYLSKMIENVPFFAELVSDPGTSDIVTMKIISA